MLQKNLAIKYQKKIEQITRIRSSVNSPKIQSKLFTNNVYYIDDMTSLYRRDRSKSLSYLTDKKIFKKRSNSISVLKEYNTLHTGV